MNCDAIDRVDSTVAVLCEYCVTSGGSGEKFGTALFQPEASDRSYAGFPANTAGGSLIDLSPYLAMRDFMPTELPDPRRFGRVFQRRS